jgi:preprotein translocase subunit YajC
MLISPAFAQDAGGGGGADMLQLLPLVLIFVVFYFLLIRPQQKKMKAHRQLVEKLRRGDRVVTGGGLIGSVTKVTSDTEVQVEIAENVRVKVVRQTIQDVLSKSEPAGKEKGKSGEAKPANDDAVAGVKKGGFGLSSLFGGGKRGQ